MLEFCLTGAEVLHPDGLRDAPLSVAGGFVVADGGRRVDLSGYLVLPGIIDAHGDGFERHLAPRRGAMKDIDQGLIAAEAELAANGITTAVLAQFYSWEGGMRGPEFAQRVMAGIAQVRGAVVTDLLTQLRFEIAMLDAYADMRRFVAQHDIGYVVFNDHLPHDALDKGKRPPRLTGQALRIGRNPEKHLEMMQELHAGMDAVPAALDGLCADLAAGGIRMGSHDDRTGSGRAAWRARGVAITEFPETPEAIEAAHLSGDPVIMGAPNVVRGGSHNGNASAAEMVMMGQVDALASDYHYPSMKRAAFFLADAGVCDLAAAWHLISAGPARVLGLTDRGVLAPGQRADLVVLEAETRRVAACMSGGRFSYLSGAAAERFVI
ncbi:alpha-D-ribose 1-methylphosphonate 5-triphosphate diphosphatase [Roseovarius aestuarii]|nr:alpha-D-ribose 1-methylphosphonate 5-triphosphate diphosphatase [Roseovarius aestuarii]